MAEAVIGTLKPTLPPKPGSTTPGSGVNDSAIGYPSPGKIADIRSNYTYSNYVSCMHCLRWEHLLTRNLLIRNYQYLTS